MCHKIMLSLILYIKKILVHSVTFQKKIAIFKKVSSKNMSKVNCYICASYFISLYFFKYKDIKIRRTV